MTQKMLITCWSGEEATTRTAFGRYCKASCESQASFQDALLELDAKGPEWNISWRFFVTVMTSEYRDV